MKFGEFPKGVVDFAKKVLALEMKTDAGKTNLVALLFLFLLILFEAGPSIITSMIKPILSVFGRGGELQPPSILPEIIVFALAALACVALLLSLEKARNRSDS